MQQGTPTSEVNGQTSKKAQLRIRRDHEPHMSTENGHAEGNMTFQSGFHTHQTGKNRRRKVKGAVLNILSVMCKKQVK